jgi:serine/threonine-protein kinase
MNEANEKELGARAGDVLAGKYRVDRVLGAGGMGVVVAAHHLELDERVALKFLLPEMLDNAECVLRFAREARAAVKIKSEHVARVIDVGKLENGSPYMVMEYLEGEDLSAWVQRGPLPIEQAVDFVLQASEAIAEAHSLHIVHRDLKPANLFCIRRPDGQLSIKVLDFGISKRTNSPQEVSMTRTAAVIGSPVYMSPEQMKSSKTVDARTDIWALGVILFELVTGRLPFQGDTVTEVAIHIAMDPMPPMSSCRPETPPALEAVIARCLEKDAARRYQNVGELAADLVQFGSARANASFEGILGTLRSSGITDGPVLSARAPTRSAPEVPHGSTVASWQTTPGGKRASRTIAGALAMVAVLGATVVGLLVSRRTPPPPSPPTQATVAEAPTLPLAPAAPVLGSPAAPPATGAEAAPAPPVPDVPKTAPSHAMSPQRPMNTKLAATAGPASAPASPAAAAPPPPAARPAAAAAAPPPAAPAKARCDPPYFFDAQGNRVFKKECL